MQCNLKNRLSCSSLCLILLIYTDEFTIFTYPLYTLMYLQCLRSYHTCLLSLLLFYDIWGHLSGRSIDDSYRRRHFCSRRKTFYFVEISHCPSLLKKIVVELLNWKNAFFYGLKARKRNNTSRREAGREPDRDAKSRAQSQGCSTIRYPLSFCWSM